MVGWSASHFRNEPLLKFTIKFKEIETLYAYLLTYTYLRMYEHTAAFTIMGVVYMPSPVTILCDSDVYSRIIFYLAFSK